MIHPRSLKTRLDQQYLHTESTFFEEIRGWKEKKRPDYFFSSEHRQIAPLLSFTNSWLS